MCSVYRILPLLLWATVVATAPQEAVNSNITYVKIEPIIDDGTAEKNDTHRQSRIENLPLIIPGNITQEAKEVEGSQSESSTDPKFERSDNRIREDSGENSSQERTKKFQRRYSFRKTTKPPSDEIKNAEPVNTVNESKSNETKNSESNTNLPEENKSNSDSEVSETKLLPEIKVSENSEELHITKETSSTEVDPTAVDLAEDSIAAETNKFEKQIDITTASSETNDPGTSEGKTIKLEVQNITRTPVQEISTKPTYTKLGYFGKSRNTPLNNLIEKSGKRRFRSKCRCEKIWNCPKLQISVARCPDEYFLCCF